jgi:predicted transcriptional regulator
MGNVSDFEQDHLSQDNILDSARELVNLLINMGVNPHTSRALICLHIHGPSSSPQLQDRCMMRQPDVSIAIRQLKEMGMVNIESITNGTRGRPSHVYSLAHPLKSCLAPFLNIAHERLEIIQNQLAQVSDLTKVITIS